ncbi:rhodanese-like domain-containing protein [Halothiobacillus sp.]|uniref:rhodanese-like domain-containing protein n=1 Tax=Halothiobacillus sp. TaxID=1891311 RepID=UPI002637D1D2|nr:rhodanese-like domain-containing protein [Halothiobacillus sp.]MDD3577329.1 rhodanese-like domain-containing protein [Halothiobacillus sp.]MDD4966045.1 rhodanese-like domain-containing protein [Halothiobacillus sp.]
MFVGRTGLGLVCALLLGGATAGMAVASADEMKFPLRAQYETVGVKPISTADLLAHFKNYTIIDARSEYEYQTLHIEGAESVPLSSPGFDQSVKALAEKTKKPLVFYCNGTTCEKSYKAAVRAMQSGVKQVLVYDAGIFHWAEANPGKTDLLGKKMQSASQLISKADFAAHLLSPRDFYERVMGDPNAIVLDIRDAGQRAGVSLFQMRDVHVPLDNARLTDWVDRAKRENRAMFFIDATGHQVQWLQYYLKEQGLHDYWFMKGGAKAFYDTL